MPSLHELRVKKPMKIQGGVVLDEEILALHPERVENIQFIPYTSPPTVSAREDKVALDEWQERVAYIQEDFTWLLKLPHDKFWCQVIFDTSLQRCITSFLRAAPRPHENVSSDAGVKTTIDSVSRLVFLTCLRMSTCKESVDHFITPAVFGDIIYENFIFDIPRLFDICSVYGPTNRPLVEKMVDNIFRNQPKYHGDLRATIPTLLQVLDAICDKCGVSSQGSGIGSSPKRLHDGASSPLVKMSTAQFDDIVSYVSDVGQTLWTFLEIYPAGANDFTESDFPMKLASIYEMLSGAFCIAFASRAWPLLSVLDECKRRVHRAQVCLLHVFQCIVFHSCLQPLLDQRTDTEGAEKYIHVMMSILGEKRFLAHYQHIYPFSDEQDILSQSTDYVVDDTRLQYIRDAISDATRMYMSANQSARLAKAKVARSKPKKTNESTEASPRDQASLQGASAASSATNITPSSLADEYQVEGDDTNDYDDSNKGACASRITGVELDSLISSVQDLLPDLGEGFIKLCLEEYNYNVERVVNALLEDKLLPALQDIDRSLPREIPRIHDVPHLQDTYDDPPEFRPPPPSILDQRRNIYDDDEFDVLSHDVDVSRIHRGKKDKLGKTFLDDKTSLVGLKPLMERYGSEFVESVYDKDVEYEDAYEDEYDDTYDSHVVGAIDDDSADEMTSRRQQFVSPFATAHDNNSVLRPFGRETENDDPNFAKPRDQFVEDPAKLREMQEQRRATKEAMRRRGGPPPPPVSTTGPGPQEAAAGRGEGANKTYDVKGVAKGHGQSAEVLRNRAWKEKHKGGNRRAMADNKRRV